MATTKPRPAGKVVGIIRAKKAPRAAKPAGPAKVDVKVLFESTMLRFPKTMARLAE